MPVNPLRLNALAATGSLEPAWQWQPILTQHEPNPPITLENPVSSVPMRSTLRVWTLRR
jgi:hypothetical protein